MFSPITAWLSLLRDSWSFLYESSWLTQMSLNFLFRGEGFNRKIECWDEIFFDTLSGQLAPSVSLICSCSDDSTLSHPQIMDWRTKIVPTSENVFLVSLIFFSLLFSVHQMVQSSEFVAISRRHWENKTRQTKQIISNELLCDNHHDVS